MQNISLLGLLLVCIVVWHSPLLLVNASEYWECSKISGHPHDPPRVCVSPFSHRVVLNNVSVYLHLNSTVSGRVKTIKYFAATGGKIFLSFWRPTNTSDTFELVGKVVLRTDDVGYHTYDVPVSERFSILTGDLLGHHFEAPAGEDGVLCVGDENELHRTGVVYELEAFSDNLKTLTPGDKLELMKMSGRFSPGIQVVVECRCSVTCAGDVCDGITGKCTKCKTGWSGVDCNVTCPLYTYGPGCKSDCSSNCVDRLCDGASGACLKGCGHGYMGEKCDTECEDGFYGVNCQEVCGNCKELKPCTKKFGICINGCEDGYEPPFCNTTCSAGRYGYNCALFCGKCSKTTECRANDGECTGGCKIGYLGTHCWINAIKTQCRPQILDDFNIEGKLDDFKNANVSIPFLGNIFGRRRLQLRKFVRKQFLQNLN